LLSLLLNFSLQTIGCCNDVANARERVSSSIPEFASSSVSFSSAGRSSSAILMPLAKQFFNNASNVIISNSIIQNKISLSYKNL